MIDRNLLRRPRIRLRATAWIVLASLVPVMIPIPVPSVSLLQQGQLSQPYPCQASKCGCRSAEQCWTSCCCHTPAERFAWAKKHGVTPPTYAVRPKPQVEKHAVSTRGTVQQHSPTVQAVCCSVFDTRAKPDNLQSQLQTVVTQSCCSPSSSASKTAPVETRERKSTVLTIMALKCRGFGAEFTGIGWAIIVHQAPRIFLQAPLIERTCSANDSAASRCLPPEPPPPRTFAIEQPA